MTDLDRLIEAVEAGGFQHSIAMEVISEQWENALHAFCGSLDAAVRLNNALLPLWEWGVDSDGVAQVWRFDADEMFVEVSRGIPARALLLATLKAYREKVQG